jgi:hypothetical protein
MGRGKVMCAMVLSSKSCKQPSIFSLIVVTGCFVI